MIPSPISQRLPLLLTPELPPPVPPTVMDIAMDIAEIDNEHYAKTGQLLSICANVWPEMKIFSCYFFYYMKFSEKLFSSSPVCYHLCPLDNNYLINYYELNTLGLN